MCADCRSELLPCRAPPGAAVRKRNSSLQLLLVTAALTITIVFTFVNVCVGTAALTARLEYSDSLWSVDVYTVVQIYKHWWPLPRVQYVDQAAAILAPPPHFAGIQSSQAVFTIGHGAVAAARISRVRLPREARDTVIRGARGGMTPAGILETPRRD